MPSQYKLLANLNFSIKKSEFSNFKRPQKLTLVNTGWGGGEVRGGGYHPPSENHNFSATEHPVDLRLVCKLKFVRERPF